MSLSNNFPTIRPSLNLDFANVKALDPRITFTRTTTATYYDGKTTAKAEENLFTYSAQFDDAAWAKSDVTVTANSTVAPDGTTTADTVTANGSNTPHAIGQNFSAGSIQRTASVFALKGTNDFIQIRAVTDTSVFADFDLDAGTVGTVGAGCTAAITASTGGFYRISITFTSATATGIRFLVVTSDTAVFNESNTLSTTVILWGAQLEQRSAVTAYTPTTTQPITNYIPVLLTAPAGVARFDHNPTTGESLGLLVEEQRTNLLTYSAEFDNSDWNKTRSSITANTIVAPDGTLTGDSLVIDTTASITHFVFQNESITSGTTYTWSVYAKAAEISEINLRFSAQFPAGNTYFNLANGTLTNAGTVVASSITPVGNGWYRCTFTQTANATGTASAQIFLSVGGTISITTANGYDSVFIWGAQLEAGAFPTSYIATTSATVTRTPDVASMTGTNFSSWYRADEGTLYADVSTPIAVPSGYFMAVFQINDGTNSNVNRIVFNTEAAASYIVTSNGVDQAILDTTGQTGIRRRVIAGAYKTNDFASSCNGSAVVTDTSGTLPVVDRVNFGSRAPSSAITTLNGRIKKIAYYPSRLSNAQLAALTTV